jgi:hypothetical protein
MPMTASKLNNHLPLTGQKSRREFLNSRPLPGSTALVNEERYAKVEVMCSSPVSEAG